MMEPSYRNELKYQIDRSEEVALNQRLRKVLKPDEHGSNGSYLVKSCYFDDIYDRALCENLFGADIRTKYRIRYYDNDPSYIVMEKKVKYVDKGYKESFRLTKSEAERMLAGSYTFLLDRPESLAREFLVQAKVKGLKPKLVVQYQRQAFLMDAGNVRVTLDTEIKTSLDTDSFFEPIQALLPERVGKCILEVKFDRYLPDLVQDLLACESVQRIAHSKYVIGRLAHR